MYVSPLQMDVTCVSPLNNYNRKNQTFVVTGLLVVKWKKRQYATYSIIALIYKIWGIKFRLISLTVYIFPVNTTSCHFHFHNIDNETFLIQNHILPSLKSQRFIGRKYRFLSFKKFWNEISKIKNLERRVVVNNRNKCKRFRKK